jgi:hypothetical protein
MIKTNVYKSIFLDSNLIEIEPYYVIHKSENLKQANINAKSYYNSYISQSKKSSMQKNKLYKGVKIATIRLKKL